jgi:simple sugar transport system substrate-binding protein
MHAHAAENYVYITHGQAADAFWSVVKNGAEAAADDLDLDLQYRSPQQFDTVQMARMIDAAVAGKPGGLVVSIPDAEALGPSIQRAVKRGIPVISINSGEEFSAQFGALLHIGQSEYEAAKRAGDYMRAKGVSNAVCVNQEQGNAALDIRCNGFADGLAGRSDVLAVTLDPTEIRNTILAYLKNHPQVDGLLTLGATSAEAAIPAMAQYKDGKHDILLGTFDLTPVVLEAIDDGKIEFALDQQQFLQGYLPLVMLHNYVRAGLRPAANIQTGPNFITRDTAADVIEFSRKGLR